MLKKFCISLFIFIYTVTLTGVSFADEVSAGDTAGAVEMVTVSEIPVPSENEAIPLPSPGSVEAVVETVTEPISDTVTGLDASIPAISEIIPLTSSESGETLTESNTSFPSESDILIDLLSAGEEIIPTTEEIPSTTVAVEVEENSIFTPPDPEPEPWQPTFVDNTIDISEGRSETQSDPVFLAENSIFTRRMTSEVIVDPFAKHRCKVDIFHTDISESPNSLLEVKFYGTSTLASYDAEIGSLPDGIDVRFEKNNDYMYDFRGKETLLKLVVNKQDSSLSGDFTIPIIYTYKGKKESTVICQLNIINEEKGVASFIVPETVEPIIMEPEKEMEATVEEDDGNIMTHNTPISDPIEEVMRDILTPSPEDYHDLIPIEIDPVPIVESLKIVPQITEQTIIPEILPQPENGINTPISDPIEEVMQDILTPSPEDNLESVPLQIDPVPIVEFLTPPDVPKT